MLRRVAHLTRRELALQAEGGERAGGFADVPFHGMQAESAIGHGGDAEVFAGGQQILHAHGHERAERDLLAPMLAVAGFGDARGSGLRRLVDIDAIAADADAVGILHRAVFRGLRVRAEVLLERR